MTRLQLTITFPGPCIMRLMGADHVGRLLAGEAGHYARQYSLATHSHSKVLPVAWPLVPRSITCHFPRCHYWYQRAVSGSGGSSATSSLLGQKTRLHVENNAMRFESEKLPILILQKSQPGPSLRASNLIVSVTRIRHSNVCP